MVGEEEEKIEIEFHDECGGGEEESLFPGGEEEEEKDLLSGGKDSLFVCQYVQVGLLHMQGFELYTTSVSNACFVAFFL